MTKHRFSREIRVETFSDGKWTDSGPLHSVSLDVPFKGHRTLRIMSLSGAPEREVLPPWRIFLDRKVVARTGWGGVTRFCKKAYG